MRTTASISTPLTSLLKSKLLASSFSHKPLSSQLLILSKPATQALILSVVVASITHKCYCLVHLGAFLSYFHNFSKGVPVATDFHRLTNTIDHNG